MHLELLKIICMLQHCSVRFFLFSTLTAAPDYIRFFYTSINTLYVSFKHVCYIDNMISISKISESLTFIFQILNNFHPLEVVDRVKWNESGFRPPLCTYRLNWARRTSWGWWDDWDDTVLQTQNSKFEPWRSEAEHATSRSRRLPTILTFTRGWGRNNFVSFKPPRPGTEPRTLAWKAAVLTTTLGPPPLIASARHNFKWVKITIDHLGSWRADRGTLRVPSTPWIVPPPGSSPVYCYTALD